MLIYYLTHFSRVEDYIFHKDGFVSTDYFSYAIRFHPSLALKVREVLEKKLSNKNNTEIGIQMTEFASNEYNESLSLLEKKKKYYINNGIYVNKGVRSRHRSFF